MYRFVPALLLALPLAAPIGALAQGSPGLIPGQIVTDGTGRLTNSTAPQWNGYFSAKQNYSATINCIAQGIVTPPANSFVVLGSGGVGCQSGTFGAGLSFSGGVLSVTGLVPTTSVLITSTGTIPIQAASIVVWQPASPSASATFQLTTSPSSVFPCQTFINSSKQTTYPMIISGNGNFIGPSGDSTYQVYGPQPVQLCWLSAASYWNPT